MAADALFMDFQRKRLTGALVVGNTLGLGCHAVLGSEGVYAAPAVLIEK